MKKMMSYIGSDYAKNFKISHRLYLHSKCNKTYVTLANHLVARWIVRNLEEAKKLISNFTYLTIEQTSLEYELIYNIPGTLTSKGIKK